MWILVARLMRARHAVFDNCQNFTITGGTFIVQATNNDPDESGEIPRRSRVL
jgi:hypothetical protein